MHRITALPSMDHEHGTVCQPILEHQVRPSSPSSVISRPTCFSSSLRCCWQVGSAPFVQRRCWLFSEFGAVYKYSDLLTYLLTYLLSAGRTTWNVWRRFWRTMLRRRGTAPARRCRLRPISNLMMSNCCPQRHPPSTWRGSHRQTTAFFSTPSSIPRSVSTEL